MSQGFRYPALEEAIRVKAVRDVVVGRVHAAVDRGVRPCLCITAIAESVLLSPLQLKEMYKHLPVQIQELKECPSINLKVLHAVRTGPSSQS